MVQTPYSAESTQLGMILEKLDHIEDDQREIKEDMKAHVKESTGPDGLHTRLLRVENRQAVLLWVVRIVGAGLSVVLGAAVVRIVLNGW